MSKTTPEEAQALADKHGFALFDSDYYQLAGLLDEVRGVDAEPVAKHVGIVSGILGDICTIQLNGYAVRKGDKLYTHPAPSQPAAPVELPVVGALWEYIGKDPMGHRIEPCCRALHEMNPDAPTYPDTWKPIDKVVKLSDAQAAIAAGGKAS